MTKQEQKDEDELSFGQAVKIASTNIGSSGKEFVSNLWGALKDPVKTGDGILKIVAGYAYQIAGKEGEYRQYSDATTQYVTSRYGSWAKLKRTFADDPVGVAGDMSTFVSLGGGILKVGATTAKVGSKVTAGTKAADVAAKTGKALDKAAEVAGKVSSAIDPLGIPGKVVDKVPGGYLDPVKKAVKKVPTPVARISKSAAGVGGTGKSIENEDKKRKK